MYLKYYKKDFPDAIMILKDNEYYMINSGEHYVFKIIIDEYIVISHFNGKETLFPATATYTEYDIYEMFFNNNVYEEVSLDKFLKLKAFL